MRYLCGPTPGIRQKEKQMKKMSRFRKWLIKRLGGILPEDSPQVFVTERPITKYETKYAVLYEEQDKIPLSHIQQRLVEQFADCIKPSVRFDTEINLSTHIVTYRARLDVVQYPQDDTKNVD